MSRIGKKPVAIPSGVKVALADRTVKVSGPKGELAWTFAPNVSVEVDTKAAAIRVLRAGDSRQDRTMHGTTRALINNMVTGVTTGYRRAIEIYGTGYSCKVTGKMLELTLGFAHPVSLPIPDHCKIEIEVPATKGNETPAKFAVTGIDKQVVGQFCRMIKDVRPPEPYLGKGVRFAGEQIRRKAGKAFAGAGGAA
ncbi:MAG: 50S ribosomal protein L6 [Phycisphaerae bacterium]